MLVASTKFFYTMGCPPVREDNPPALASGLSYIQVDNPWFYYSPYNSVDIAQHGLFRAKVGKGGIRLDMALSNMRIIKAL